MLFSTKAADDTDRVRVKICGLTREDDVVMAVEGGADAVGFVCYPASARYVSQSRLMSLISLVPESVTPVLVFVNPTSEEVRDHIALFPRAVLQFHGQESRAFCDQFHRPYIKAVAVKSPDQLLKVQDDYPMANAIVADVDDPSHGGTGEVFDWNAVAQIRDKIKKPLIVAGGLMQGMSSRLLKSCVLGQWMWQAVLNEKRASRITIKFWHLWRLLSKAERLSLMLKKSQPNIGIQWCNQKPGVFIENRP